MATLESVIANPSTVPAGGISTVTVSVVPDSGDTVATVTVTIDGQTGTAPITLTGTPETVSYSVDPADIGAPGVCVATCDIGTLTSQGGGVFVYTAP